MQRYLGYSLLVVLMSLAILGCRSSVPAGLSDADKAAIRSVTEKVVALSNATTKDWDAYVRTDYTPDAVVLPPDTPAVQGWDAIKAYIITEGKVLDFKCDILEMEGQGDLAYVRGTYSMTVIPTNGSEPTKGAGKYIEIWRKQADGTWKVIRDIFNSDMPTPAPPAPAPAKPRKK